MGRTSMMRDRPLGDASSFTDDMEKEIIEWIVSQDNAPRSLDVLNRVKGRFDINLHGSPILTDIIKKAEEAKAAPKTSGVSYTLNTQLLV